jgi:glycosyltransferase involved in cell wall biosynthesis
LRILLIHNRYQQPGGEDSVFEAEKRLLLDAGHSVIEYTRHNDEIADYGLWQKATLAPRTVWAWDSYHGIKSLLERERPDVAHAHNTFPLISPAAYYACWEARVPVVQSLHNPRLLCPGATLCREGKTCQECLGAAFPWRAVLHGCYRDSRAQTCTVAAMLGVHRWLDTWSQKVARYLVFTDFYRREFISGGLPAEKILTKPHFVAPDPGLRREPGAYALFVGRLATEKGVHTLLGAWQRLTSVPLLVRGEGPLADEVRRFTGRYGSNLKLVPRLGRSSLVSVMKRARFLVWPSEGYYETFGLVAVEAFACGVPVIASRLGAMAEIVEDGKTGLHFTPGDPEDLAAKVEWAWAHPREMEEMGRAGRAEYESKYTAQRNYELLMDTYHSAIQAA